MIDFNNLPLKDKIYYQDDDVVIYCADCRDILPLMPEKSVDLAIADYPYNISNYGNSLTKKGSEFTRGDFGIWDKWEDMEEYLRWVFDVAKVIQGRLKELSSGLFFFDNRQAGWIAYELERRGIFVYKSPIIWVKNNPIPHVRKTGFRSSFEHGVWVINSQERYIGNARIVIKPRVFNFQEQEEMMNVMSYNIGQKVTSHETEKPASLTELIISIFTNPNDLILDPFLGSGTTAYCAKKLSRKCIGIEISEEYCAIAVRRCSQAVMRLDTVISPKILTQSELL